MVWLDALVRVWPFRSRVRGAVFRNHHILRKVVEQLHAGLTGFQRFGDSGVAVAVSLHVVGGHLAAGDQIAQLSGRIIVEGDLTPLIRHAVDIGPGVTAGGGDSHIGQGAVGGIVVSVAAVTHHQSRHGDLVAAAPVAIQVLVFSIDVSGVQLDVGVGDLGGPAPGLKHPAVHRRPCSCPWSAYRGY